MLWKIAIFLFDRDITKWYHFSKINQFVMLCLLISWIIEGSTDYTLWAVIVGLNVFSTYFNSKNEK